MLINTACLTEKNGILMHLVLCTMPLYYLSEQLDVATGREHGSGFVLPGQATQRKASRGDARQGKPSRCVGQARRERCPLVLKNTVPVPSATGILIGPRILHGCINSSAIQVEQGYRLYLVTATARWRRIRACWLLMYLAFHHEKHGIDIHTRYCNRPRSRKPENRDR